MLLHEGLINIQSQIKPPLLFDPTDALDSRYFQYAVFNGGFDVRATHTYPPVLTSGNGLS